MYLYEVTYEYETKLKYFKIGDDSGERSREFLIDPHNTAVTEYKITVDWCCWRITIYPNENTFDLYQDLFPLALRDFSVSIDAHCALF